MKNNKKNTILITGCAGFIGMHLSKALIRKGYFVYGIDNLNDYYSVDLKNDRLKNLEKYDSFRFETLDISNSDKLSSFFSKIKPRKVINLAAQAGVRYSLENPEAYISSNIHGFMNILECCRYNNIEGLVYASSSSVYGSNKDIPFAVKDRTDSPISIYAATKKANELMAHSYSHLFGIHTTGLRFFTVYGPWGRPDMALYKFVDKIENKRPISIYNHGNMNRDFTYIDDIINGIIASLEANHKHRIYNLGNNRVEKLMDMVKIIEQYLSKKAEINYLDMQPGDVQSTYADVELSIKELNFKPQTSIETGIPKFIDWYKSYHLNK